jgi:hypothetical protein
MPRLSFFRRESLSEEENKRWMIYWAIYAVTMFAILFTLSKFGIELTVWEKLATFCGVLLIFGLVYYMTGKRRKS